MMTTSCEVSFVPVTWFHESATNRSQLWPSGTSPLSRLGDRSSPMKALNPSSRVLLPGSCVVPPVPVCLHLRQAQRLLFGKTYKGSYAKTSSTAARRRSQMVEVVEVEKRMLCWDTGLEKVRECSLRGGAELEPRRLDIALPVQAGEHQVSRGDPWVRSG